ncbi:MAG: phage capsid protein [Roseiarcus sp.]
MAQEAPNWYVQAYIDRAIEVFQAKGHKLRGMYTQPARIQANVVNWMIAGKGEAVPLVRGGMGSAMNASRTTVSATMADWQAADWVWQVDIAKMTANEMEVVQSTCGMALGRRADLIPIGVMNAASLTVVSDGATANANGTGFTLPMALAGLQTLESQDVEIDDGDVFCGLPSLAWNQFMSYRQVNDADWVGYDGQPYKAGMKFKNWNGCKWFLMSDRYAQSPGPSYQQDFFVWHKKALGFAMNYDIKSVVTWENIFSGWYHNNIFAATAAVLLPAGIIRFRINPLSAITVN